MAFPTKVRGGRSGPSAPLEGFAPNQEFVTIRLVPSRDAAREFLGVFRIWGGEIVRERVKVHWQHARDSFSAIGAG